jgi:hypothetical protein
MGRRKMVEQLLERVQWCAFRVGWTDLTSRFAMGRYGEASGLFSDDVRW